jgi:DNA mismatch repair protein MutH
MNNKYIDVSSILKRASESIGLTIREICDSSSVDIKELNIKNKGNIGNLIEEHWFSIKNNNSPLPDFAEAGIELKVIPLAKNKDNSYFVKERTKICSIDYHKLIDEKWDDSHAKIKINKILFMYYFYDKADILNSTIKKIDLFELKGNDALVISNDWNSVHNYVKEGKAHELSETISSVLAASRSGSGGTDKYGVLKDLVSQPIKTFEDKALKRAFSLKQSFTNQRWNEINKKKYESILETLHISNGNFEKEIILKLKLLEDLTLGEVAKKFDINVPNGKNAAATIIKKSIGFKNVNSRIKEFEQLGIQVKTISTRKSDFKPWEAVSFPTFKLKELVKEQWDEGIDEEEGLTWERCSFKEEINRILFIPILKNEKEGVPTDEKVIGKAFFWSPSSTELEIIKKEWENYIDEINNGKVEVTRKPIKNGYKEISKLSKESDTKVIHIRPHSKDRKDRDEDHLGNSIVKQSFWLNKNFLQKLLKNNYNIS